MKKQDITTQATTIVKQYMDLGFIAYPKAMGGSQGQDWSFILRNGNSGVSISCWNQNGYGMDYDSYEIWIEVFDVQKFEESGSTFWYQSEKDWKLGKQVIKFYDLNSNKFNSEPWYVTEDEVEEAKAKHQQRVLASHKKSNRTVTFRSERAKELAVDIAKKHRGYKRTKIEDVNAISLSIDFLGNKHIVIDLNRKPSKNASIKLIIDK